MACTPEIQAQVIMYAEQALQNKQPVRPDVLRQLNECAGLAGNQGPAQDELAKVAGTPTALTDQQAAIAATADAYGTPSPTPTSYNQATATQTPSPTPQAYNLPPTSTPLPAAAPTATPSLFGGAGPMSPSPYDVSSMQPYTSPIQSDPRMNGATMSLDPSELAGLAGGAGSSMSPSPYDVGVMSSPQAPRDNLMGFLMNDPNSWLAQSGLGAEDLSMVNPYDQAGLMQALDIYGDQTGQPGWWKSQVQPFAQSLPGLMGLANPGQSMMTTPEYLQQIPELSGSFNTPGSYIDPRQLWDTGLFGGGGMPGHEGNINDRMPDDQISLVTDALGSLSPYISPDTLNDISNMTAQAALDWKAGVANGTETRDFITYLQQEKGADNWL